MAVGRGRRFGLKARLHPLGRNGAGAAILSQGEGEFRHPRPQWRQDGRSEAHFGSRVFDPFALGRGEVRPEAVARRQRALSERQAAGVVVSGLIEGQFEPQVIGSGQGLVEGGRSPVQPAGQQVHGAKQHHLPVPTLHGPHRRPPARLGDGQSQGCD
jgi:hypothetical protein